MGADYDGEIFSVLANDRKDLICSAIRKYGSKESIACDFGCGVGKFLPILSRNFQHVHAFDISQHLLDQASNKCKKLTNITYLKKDLSKTKLKSKEVDFALSVNVAIMASHKKRNDIFETITKHLRHQGHLLLVVPSLESALYADFRLVQWNLRHGLSPAEAVSELKDSNDATALSLRRGLVEIDSVPTKHYLKEELVAIFEKTPLDILSVEKIEYSWKTEFDSPPKWMKKPYPWDWFVLLKKVRN